MQPGGIRPQPPLTRQTAPTAFALRNIPDRKARGRLRAAATAEAIGRELEWLDAEGWRYQLEAPPRVTIAPKDIERAAATVDLKVWDATGTLIFRDRIHAWDGFPVLVPDGTVHEETDEHGEKREVDNFREDPVAAARSDLAHTVRVVTTGGKEPWVKAKPGTVSTFYSGTSDGYLAAVDATYATARSGSGLGYNDTSSTFVIGQQIPANYQLYEAFVQFDTSSIPDDEVASSVTLSLYGTVDLTDVDFIAEARVYDWGTSLTTGDWVAGASLSSLTRVATHNSTGFSTGAYNDFSEDGSAFRSAIAVTGATRLMLVSDRLVSGTAPTGNEVWIVSSSDESGTSQDPKLVVTHAAAAISVTPGTASLTTATFAPTTRLDKIVAPGAASLSVSLFAPTALAPRAVTPGALALTTETFVPALSVGLTAVPGTLATLLEGFAPTVLAPRAVTPSTLAVTLSLFAPSAPVGKIAAPGAAALVLAAFAPVIIAPQSVTPGTLEVVTATFAPIASTGQNLTPDQASLLLTAFAPLILTPVVVEPGIGELVTATFAPTTRLDKYAFPGAASLSLTAFAPDAVDTTDVYLTPGTASLVIATYAPDIVIPIWLPGPQRGVGRYTATPVSGLGRVPFVMRGAGRFDRPQRGGGR